MTTAQERNRTPAADKILVVEDDLSVQRLLERLLKPVGYEVHCAEDAETGIALLEDLSPNLVILDVMLPTMNGLSLCRMIRVSHNLPILMLSSRAQTVDRVTGLDVGADDYLAKPFDGSELVARVKALLRRQRPENTPPPQSEEGLVIGPLQIDLRAHMSRLHGVALELTPTEFDLLRVLATDQGRAFSRDRLLNLVWGENYEGAERLVDSHIKHLRKKLAKIDPKYRPITAVRGLGYRFQA